MKVKGISWATADLVMNAFACAYLELVHDGDEDYIDDAEAYAKSQFPSFCTAFDIYVVEVE